MRGLSRGSLVLVSAGTVVLVGTALFVVGCASGGTGLKDGGPARTETVAKTAPPPLPTGRCNASARDARYVCR